MAFNISRFLPIAVIAMIATVFFMEPVLAQNASGGLAGAESALNKIVGILTGNVARLIAIIACILIGLAFMFGFVDLRTVGYFIIGTIIVFGATEVVDLLKTK